MTEDNVTPDGWALVTDDVDPIEIEWKLDDAMSISITESDGVDGQQMFKVIVEQYLEDEEMGVSTTVQSHGMMEESKQHAIDVAQEFMEEVNGGQHRLRLMEVEMWEEFYQFYTISDTQLPDSITADELIDAIDNERYDDDLDDLPDDFDPENDADRTIQIDVFPRHKAEIETD